MTEATAPYRHSRPLVATLALAGLLAVACGSGPAATPAVNRTSPPAGSTPAAPTPAGGNPTGAAPAGATTFHLVLADGPKAGTYDIISTDPAACSIASVGYFSVSYYAADGSGLSYIDGHIHADGTTGLTYMFDTDSDSKIIFSGDGDVSVDVDDRGTTATVRVVSETNVGTSPTRTAVHTGQAELTVDCASVPRPNVP